MKQSYYLTALLLLLSRKGRMSEESLYRKKGQTMDHCTTQTDDTISRQAAIDEVRNYYDPEDTDVTSIEDRIKRLPSAQSELCEYYSLCRHGRDENKLRARLGFCEYCNEDSDGYVKPIEKNNHAFVRFGMNGWELSLKANGWHGSAKIRYCPMCGRDLLMKRGVK